MQKESAYCPDVLSDRGKSNAEIHNHRDGRRWELEVKRLHLIWIQIQLWISKYAGIDSSLLNDISA